jgi:hypothetical protein
MTDTPKPLTPVPSPPRIIKYLPYLQFLPDFSLLMQKIHGVGNGSTKKAGVLNMLGVIVEDAAPVVFAKNPAYAALGPLVDAAVEELKSTGQIQTVPVAAAATST